MISRELEAEILRLYHAEHWRIGTLARQLNIHHDTVRRVLTQAGIPAAEQSPRGSMAGPFTQGILNQSLAALAQPQTRLSLAHSWHTQSELDTFPAHRRSGRV
ncbi:transposase, IS21 family [mine drainage metagenome]|uniref:Transposase, IS21 family n=1 Tax=mine drainage metagenome TaxID=410659 RepID=T1ALZ4_9ZZZZ